MADIYDRLVAARRSTCFCDQYRKPCTECDNFASGVEVAIEATGLNPGEIVAVPSELPDPKNWECEVQGPLGCYWAGATRFQRDQGRRICRPINKEAGE